MWRYVLFLVFGFATANAQVMGYGPDGPDGYGMTSVGARTVLKLPKDSAVYTLPAYNFWFNQPWKESVNRFPEYQPGRLEFTDQPPRDGKWNMNYSYFLNNIVVKTDDQLVVGLARYPNLKAVYIGSTKFHVDDKLGFLEVMQTGHFTIARRTSMHCLLENSSGHRRMPLPNEDLRAATTRETRYYWAFDSYYVIDPSGNAHRLGSLTLQTLAPYMADKIRIFARIHNTNFRNLNDLFAIATYCNEHYVEDYALSTSQKVLKIDEDADIKTSRWKDSLYLFPSFEKAIVTTEFGAREEYPQLLNYNLTNGRLETINRRGDTVLFTTATRILNVELDGRYFLIDPEEGPVELLFNGKVGLGSRKQIDFLGYYNDADESEPGEKWYAINEYFLITYKNKVLLATTRNLTMMFPGHRDEIEKYILDNNVNFRSYGDLLKLVTYCMQFD
ncbi:MAG TPA: hypothetical protein VFE50_23365 [Cyclobacteriaceae bacterium]|nr:hypothetical protein [Cyclobacteriaceae bacterium]